MVNPVVSDTANGKRVEVELPIDRVAIVSHNNRDFQEVTGKLLQQMEEENSAAVYEDALVTWKEDMESGETGLPANPFDKQALIAWYLKHPSYETRWEKEDRIKAEKEAAEAAAQAEKEAAIAAAQQELADAEAALGEA